MITKVIRNLDLSKPSDPDFIPVMVLKSHEPELSKTLAELLVSEGVLFSRFLEGFISGPCMAEFWGKVYS